MVGSRLWCLSHFESANRSSPRADQGYAVAFVVLSSVGGSVVGPVVGEARLNFECKICWLTQSEQAASWRPTSLGTGSYVMCSSLWRDIT